MSKVDVQEMITQWKPKANPIQALFFPTGDIMGRDHSICRNRELFGKAFSNKHACRMCSIILS